MKKRTYHFVSRARRGLHPLVTRDRGLALWGSLRKEFPDNTLACALMPNHFHIAIVTANPARVRRSIGVILRNHSRRFSLGQSIWTRQPPIPLPVDREKLGRLIRYIHLNPCRARLNPDPWSWEFSTIRDHSRESLMPWVKPDLLEDVLLKDPRIWTEEHDRLLSLDTTVKPGITNERLLRAGFDQLSHDQVQQAVAALFSCERASLRRRGEPRDFVAQALLSQSTCEQSLMDLAKSMGVDRKRLGRMRAHPLTERAKRAIRAHAFLIHDSRSH